MKKRFLLLFLFLWFTTNIFADSNYLEDYTYIDCISWDNLTWVAFDSTKPYATLKEGIENTIDYINTNINIVWNEQTASWITFNIKVNCSFDDILNTEISLDFIWVDYNNFLVIEWFDNDSLIFKNTQLNLWNNAWNIIIKNAIFDNENMAYFYDYIFPSDRQKRHPFSKWVEIQNSYIKLNNNFNIWDYKKYKVFRYHSYNSWSGRSYDVFDYPYNYVNNIKIKNSKIDIDISNDYDFRMPIFLKDSKINFINSGTWVYGINFLENWNEVIYKDLNYTTFVSNEIDLWWNNFKTEDDIDISFLNNKFINFLKFEFSAWAIFINNYVENNETIDISHAKNLFNNIFKTDFFDSYDIKNYRRNFTISDSWKWWIGWIFKKVRDIWFFDVDVNSADLYKEVTWKNLAKGLWDIYIIFNY